MANLGIVLVGVLTQRVGRLRPRLPDSRVPSMFPRATSRLPSTHNVHLLKSTLFDPLVTHVILIS